MEILYQSKACIVVNKLKGEAVEGAKKGITDLQKAIKTHLNTDFAEAVNRLDVPVTGCALFALDSTALNYLNAAFACKDFANKENRKIEKHYWAIIEKPKDAIAETGELTHWMETNTKTNKSFAYNEEKTGRKKSTLKYKVTGEGINYLFLEIELFTGRHHQIRAQLAAVNLHIKGDLKYGARRSEKDGGIRLHARFLSFPDPLDKNERITVTADPPQADNLWNEFLKMCK